jgi:AraC-like DNA-binding protein
MKRRTTENKAYLLSGFDGDSGHLFGPRFSALHFIRAKSEFLYHVHKHDRMEMILPLNGVYKCLLNGAELSFKPGIALLVQPGDVHQDIYLPEMEYCGCIFSMESARSIFKPGTKAAAQLAEFKSLDLILRAKDALSGNESVFSEYLASSSLQTVFWEAMSSIPKNLLSPEFLEQPEREALRKRILRHFEMNISSGFNLDSMAKSMGISKSGLSHKCAELLGMPPAKAFLDFRLRRARHLLETRSMSVKDASASLGFANQFHFSRAFKRHFGIAPSSLA